MNYSLDPKPSEMRVSLLALDQALDRYNCEQSLGVTENDMMVLGSHTKSLRCSFHIHPIYFDSKLFGAGSVFLCGVCTAFSTTGSWSRTGDLRRHHIPNKIN